MIRINLLAAEPASEAPPPSAAGRRAATAGGLVVLAIALGLIARDGLAIRGESNRLDARLRVLDRDLAALADVAAQREAMERRRVDLAWRVARTQALRAAQGAPARVLEQVGRVLPDDAWLTELRQQGGRVTLAGRTPEMTGLTELVAGLESSGYFPPPIEIVESRREGGAVHFEIRARYGSSSP